MLKLISVGKPVAGPEGRLWLLRDICLEVAEGEFLSVVGPSGSGKTTLLNIIGLFDHDWRGEYFLEDEPVHSLKPSRRSRLAKDIGFVFQQYHLLDDLTVEENLEMPLNYRQVPGAERRRRVGEILDRFGIETKRKLYPTQLSGGQQQLVAVARALIGQPRLILADEPTGALHSSQGDMIMDLLAELNDQGMTILQVTHNEAFAARGHRSVELLDGCIGEVSKHRA